MRTRGGLALSRLLPLLGLLSLVALGCPSEKKGEPRPPPGPPPLQTASPAGSVSVLVQDERGRPFEGALAWVSGNKDASPLPEEPVVLTQVGIEFRPQLIVARRGQTLAMKNEDPELHNVHGNSSCCAVNISMPA